MAHIAIDARIINSSTGRYVERLIHYLEQIDQENTYTIIVRTKDKDFYTPHNPNFSIRTADYADYSFGEQIGFLFFLLSLRADLVHFCMPQQPIFYWRPHVTTIHDLTLLNTYNSDKNWFVFHAKQLVGKAVFTVIAQTNRVIFTPTAYTQQNYEAYAPAARGKTVLTYESADKLHHNATVPYPHRFKKFLLYVGQQSDYKNIARLGDAHQQLLKTHPDLGLLLVGKLNAAARKNQHYFSEKGYQNIIFTDFIDDAQRDWLYEHCAAYVFPSLMEGFGLPGLEAMHYGAPVVSSNTTCLPEVYGDAAVYFDPHDVADMAEKIDLVLSSDTTRQQCIQRGYAQVKKYSWRRMAQQTLDGYHSVLGK